MNKIKIDDSRKYIPEDICPKCKTINTIEKWITGTGIEYSYTCIKCKKYIKLGERKYL